MEDLALYPRLTSNKIISPPWQWRMEIRSLYLLDKLLLSYTPASPKGNTKLNKATSEAELNECAGVCRKMIYSTPTGSDHYHVLELPQSWQYSQYQHFIYSLGLLNQAQKQHPTNSMWRGMHHLLGAVCLKCFIECGMLRHNVEAEGQRQWQLGPGQTARQEGRNLLSSWQAEHGNSWRVVLGIGAKGSHEDRKIGWQWWRLGGKQVGTWGSRWKGRR